MNIIASLKGKVIVSAQAMPNEPFYNETAIMAMMHSAINGGAAGLNAGVGWQQSDSIRCRRRPELLPEA